MFYTPPYTVEEVLRTSSTSDLLPWGLRYVNIESAWKHSQGKNVIVCVLDSGEAVHKELKVSDFSDFSSERGTSGHATHVSGLIAGRTCGAAPAATLLVGKVLKANGAGGPANLIRGLEWAISCKADILSLSLGSFKYYPDVHAAIVACFKRGILTFAAAGNENTLGINFPALFPECISIGAVDDTGKVCDFSSRGYKLDVVAPGKDIISTYLDNSYASISGTSQATPIVAGVVACYLAHCRSRGNVINAIQVYRKLQETAWSSSVSEETGFGLINLNKLFS